MPQPRSTLRDAIVQLASDLAEGVLEAVRNVSLEDLLAEAAAVQAPVKRGPGRPRKVTTSAPLSSGHTSGSVEAAASPSEDKRARNSDSRLARRSPEEIARVVERIVALLSHNPKGLRSEEIQTKLGLVARELPRPLSEALAARRISKQGEKRATKYFASKAATVAAVSKSPSGAAGGAGAAGGKKAAGLSKASAGKAPAPKAAVSRSGKGSKSAGKSKASGGKSPANGAHSLSSASIPS